MIDDLLHGETEMMAQPSFGRWLKQRRKALDLTQPLLAQQIGCTVSALYKIEADERRPSHQIADLLAERLKIPSDQHPEFVRFARGDNSVDVARWETPFRPPCNLPTPPNPLIGREADVATVRKRLLQPQTRLLSLVGPPGVGKTRLAIQVASSALHEFADGVFFVALAPVSDAAIVTDTIANVLEMQDMGPHSLLSRIKSFLRDKQLLLVLDNFEQVLPSAPQIAELLSACLWLKVLVTSRAPLRIRTERQWPVPPLALPDATHPPAVEAVANSSAVTLFLERAQAVRPDFALTEVNAPAVASICARLDGLPLAIELISARVKLLAPEALLARLRGELLLHSDGLRDVEPRHRTLNNAIEWSHSLLNMDEQVLFRRLGIFVGGWTLEAAEAVCMEGLSLNPLDGMASLLDKNLISQEKKATVEPRFTMLETLREYALDRLVASAEAETLERRRAEYFLWMVEEFKLRYSGPQVRWQWDVLEIESPNLRAALIWSRTEPNGEALLRLAAALSSFWGRRGHLSEGIGWLTEAVQHSRDVSSEALRRLRARMLDDLGVYNQWQGDLDNAQTHGEEAIALHRELGDLTGLAEALSDYGMLCVLRGDADGAAAAIEKSLALYRELGMAGGVASCRFFQGNVEFMQQNWHQANALWEESLASWRVLGHDWMIAVVLANLGMVTIELGEYERAHARLTESLALHRELDEKWQTIQTLELMARLAVEQGQESEDAMRSLVRGAQLFGAAEKLREVYGVIVFPFHQQGYERRVDALHEHLDATTLASAWAEGRKMTLDQAVDYALSG